MLGRRSVLSMLAAAISMRNGTALAIGEWCQPFLVAHNFSSGSLAHRWMLNFEEAILTNVDSQAQFKIFPEQSLYASYELVPALSKQQASLGLMSVSTLVKFIPEVAVLEFPALVNNSDDVAKVYQGGQFLALLQDRSKAKGLRVLGLGVRPYAVVAAQVAEHSDLKGLRFRVPVGPAINLSETLGAVPQRMPFAELAQSLQTGAIDAAAIPLDVIRSSKFYEAAKSAIVTPLFFRHVILMGSEDFLQRASQEAQEGLSSAAIDTSLKYSQDVDSYIEGESAQLQQVGMDVTNFSVQSAVVDSGINFSDFWQGAAEPLGIDARKALDLLRGDLGV